MNLSKGKIYTYKLAFCLMINRSRGLRHSFNIFNTHVHCSLKLHSKWNIIPYIIDKADNKCRQATMHNGWDEETFPFLFSLIPSPSTSYHLTLLLQSNPPMWVKKLAFRYLLFRFALINTIPTRTVVFEAFITILPLCTHILKMYVKFVHKYMSYLLYIHRYI